MEDLQEFLAEIPAIDVAAQEEMRACLDAKMKPKGSLGVLEELLIQLAGIYSYPLKEKFQKAHVIAVADNGIIEEGVSSCPLDYTRLVAEAMLNKIATVAIFTEQMGMDLFVVDIGMKEDIPRDYPNLYRKKIRRGSRNFTKEAAMTEEECLAAIQEGIRFIQAKKKDYDIFSNGEMGIGNTTTSSAVLYASTSENIDDIVGYGGGLSEEGLLRKKRVIQGACRNYELFGKTTLEILQKVGGYDIAFLVGSYLGCARYRKAMIVDGFISSVAAYLACQLKPEVRDYCIFSHRSEEPGAKLVAQALGGNAFLDMKMRLGEGTGAVLVYPILDAALAMWKTLKTPKEVYDLFYEL